MKNQLLELVSAYDFEVSVIKSSEGTSLDHAEWKAKGARAADCFWLNIPRVWMDGFFQRLEFLKRENDFVNSQSPTNSNIPMGNISKKIRKMMLD